jgi:hypothetical protein
MGMIATGSHVIMTGGGAQVTFSIKSFQKNLQKPNSVLSLHPLSGA